MIQSLSSVLFPKEISLNFELGDVQEYKEHIQMRLNELQERVPSDLKHAREVVLDGFCNPIELQTFPLKGKAVYLKLYRRKWKEKGKDQAHWNNYELHSEGVKATKEFAAFLKETYGFTPVQYNANCTGIMCER